MFNVQYIIVIYKVLWFIMCICIILLKLNLFRKHKESMFNLRRLLPDDAKAKRHAGNLLNIQVTFLAWLTELFGFFIIFLGTFVLGHENNIVTLTMQTVTVVISFNILPCVYLINELHFKTKILESRWYTTFLNLLNWQYNKQNYEGDPNAVVLDNQIKKYNHDVDVDNTANTDDDKKDEKKNSKEHNRIIIILNQMKKRNNFVGTHLDSIENQGRLKCELPEEKPKTFSPSDDVDVIDLEE